MRLIALAALLAVATAPAPALAWGKTGHRVIGAIAQSQLTPRAAAQVKAILGVESLAEASTWPDFMRAEQTEFWQRTASPWHYVTVPSGKIYAEVGAPEQGDAVTALDRFAATIRDSKASLADKQLALRFIVHIVGDLHQPLHAGNGRDRGGNDVQVTFQGRQTNLHAVWDSDLVDDAQLSYTEYTAWLSARITPEQRAAWTTTDPRVWIGESTAIRDRIYPEKPEIGFAYIFKTKAIVEERLEQGGVRLAAYLNELFAAPR